MQLQNIFDRRMQLHKHLEELNDGIKEQRFDNNKDCCTTHHATTVKQKRIRMTKRYVLFFSELFFIR